MSFLQRLCAQDAEFSEAPMHAGFPDVKGGVNSVLWVWLLALFYFFLRLSFLQRLRARGSFSEIGCPLYPQ